MKTLGPSCGSSARGKHLGLHTKNGNLRLASICRSLEEGQKASTSAATQKDRDEQPEETSKRVAKRQAESTDAVATFLTRRFGWVCYSQACG
jgi:ribosome-binding protein aMBF1 (putative translation factor)